MRSLLAIAVLLLLTSCAADETSANKAGEPSPALNNGKGQLDIDTPVTQLYMKSAKRAEAAGNAQLAAVLYRAAALADKKDIGPRAASAELFEKVGEYRPAMELYNQLAKETDDVDYTLSAGRCALKLGEAKVARAQYESAIIKNPSDWRAYNGLAVANDIAGNHKAAIDNYAIAYEKAPSDRKRDVTMNWSLSLMLENRAGEALEKLEALPDAKENPQVKTRLALAYALSGRPDDAKRLGLSKVPTQQDLENILKQGMGKQDDDSHVYEPVKP